MDPRLRLLIVAASAAGVVAAVALSNRGSSSTPAVQQPTCLDVPAVLARPAWLRDDDLPLPPGSEAVDVPTQRPGLREVVVATGGSLDDFVKFILREWPAHGWKNIGGEREIAEAEGAFTGTDGRTAAFRARAVYCGDRAELRLIIVERTVATPPPFVRTSPASSASPLAP